MRYFAFRNGIKQIMRAIPVGKKFCDIVEKDGLFRYKSVDLSRGSLESEFGDDMYTVDSLYITGEYRDSDSEAFVNAVIDVHCCFYA